MQGADLGGREGSRGDVDVGYGVGEAGDGVVVEALSGLPPMIRGRAES
ncbi:hypothetical protein AB0L10_44755 [Streptomyces flaveolus]